jgi:hypothetical protein
MILKLVQSMNIDDDVKRFIILSVKVAWTLSGYWSCSSLLAALSL